MTTDGQDGVMGTSGPAGVEPEPLADSEAAIVLRAQQGLPAQTLPPPQSIPSQGPPQPPAWPMPPMPPAPPAWSMPPAPPAAEATAPGPASAPGYPPAYPGYPGQPAPGYVPGAWPQQAWPQQAGGPGHPGAPGYPGGPGYPGYPGGPGYPGYPGAPAYPYTPAYPPGYPGAPYPPPAPGFGYPPAAWPVAPGQFGPAPGVAWASIGHRIGALFLDGVFIFVALVVAAGIAEAFGVQHYTYSNVYSTGATVSYLIWFVLLAAYHPTCWWAFQGSIGQRLLGLRVVRAADGGSLGVGSTTIRYIIWALCTGLVIPGIIAAVMANDQPHKRTWWDDAAGSVVVRRA